MRAPWRGCAWGRGCATLIDHGLSQRHARAAQVASGRGCAATHGNRTSLLGDGKQQEGQRALATLRAPRALGIFHRGCTRVVKRKKEMHKRVKIQRAVPENSASGSQKMHKHLVTVAAKQASRGGRESTPATRPACCEER